MNALKDLMSMGRFFLTLSIDMKQLVSVTIITSMC